MGDLSEHFSKAEFACKCGCGFDAVSRELVDILEASRQKTGLPYHINAGCRCPAHNAAVGGKPNSAHLRGLAADIACTDSHVRYALLRDLLTRFRRVEIGNTWLHVDVDGTLPQEVVFLAEG